MVNISNKNRVKKIIHFIARIVLGGIFIFASIDKIAFPSDFALSIQNYNILPIFLIKPAALILPWVELISGILLLVGLFIKESALILTSLMVIFLIALGIQAIKGPIEDCGCFGRLAFLSSSNVYVLVARDFVFLSLGLVILFFQKRIKLNEGKGY